MKKKFIVKRTTSIALSLALVAGLVGSSLAGLFAPKGVSAAELVDYKPAKLGVNVLPRSATDNSTFMKKYVLTSGTNMNVNDMFKLVSWKNIDDGIRMSKGNGLTRSKLMHEDNKNWYADYTWTFSSSQSTLKELMGDGQIRLTYDGNLTSDHHWNFWSHWKEKWDVAKINISGGSGNVSLISQSSQGRDDEQGQHYVLSVDSNSSWSSYDRLSFSAGHSGCNCGSSGVSQSVIYLTDEYAPRVTSTYVAYDSAGNNKISSGSGLTAGATAYVVMNFNENIRFANTQAETLQLELDAYYKKNDQRAGTIKANLISVVNNRMVFKFTVPATYNNEPTDLYIKSVSNSQSSFIGSSNQYTLYYLDKNGEAFSKNADATGKVSSKITDLAGNGINWSRSSKSFGKIYLDNNAPEFAKTEISGSMMDANTTKPSNQWPEDMDRSSVFAGVGDELTFTVYFSEQLNINNNDLNNIYAQLNVKDSSGNTVKLKANSIKTSSAKSVFGVDAGSYNITKITFDKFTVEAGMVPSNVDGVSIQIVGIQGMGSTKDMVGNVLASVAGNLDAAAQQEYLDTLGPVASTDILLEDGKDVYVPNSDGSTIFTFPISVNDDKSVDNGTGAYASGVTGLTGSFSVIMDGESKEFQYYVDTNSTASKYSYKWKNGKTSSNISEAEKYDLLQLDGANKAYIHIMLDENTDYGYNVAEGVKFNATLVVNAKDFAGNERVSEFKIAHDMDWEVPTAEAVSNNIIVDGESSTATITANVKLRDNYGIKTVKYKWDDAGLLQDYNIGAGILTEVEVSIPIEFTFTEDVNTRQGTKKLTIAVEDYNGKQTIWTKEYSYSFLKPVGNYTIQSGSVEAPVIDPVVTIDWAKNSNNTGTQPYTMMIMPTGLQENGENVYYAFLQDLIKPDENIFARLPKDENANTNAYEFLGNWYKLVGNVTDSGGSFSSYEQIESASLYEVYQFIHGYYGKLEVVFVTSQEMNGGYAAGSSSQYDPYPSFNNFSYTTAMSVIKNESIYLANDADYGVIFSDIIDENGYSVEDDVFHDMEDESDTITAPYPTLDGMSVVIETVNNKETLEALYGLNAISYAESYAQIQYYNGSIWQTKSTVELAKLVEQSITIPYGTTTDTGYYRVVVTLSDIEGNKMTFEGPEYFADVTTVDFVMSEYNKVYQYLGEDGTGTKTVRAAQKYDMEETGELTVGLADVHKYWSLSEGEGVHEIIFTRDYTSEVDRLSQDMIVGVWNKMDEMGQEYAVWLPANDISSMEFVYTPVRVDEFTADSYGSEDKLLLPLKEGENIICYKIVNTNGIETTKEILINVSTAYNDFELDIRKTATEAVITPVVSDSALMAEPVVKEFWFSSDYMSKTDGDIPTYTVIRSNPYEFYMLDKYGNLSYQSCVIEEVDGEAPFYAGFTTGTTYDDTEVGSDGFHFTFYVNDWAKISPEDAYLTFDADYSALLMGLTGEERANNTEQITMKIPVNLEQDENGYMVWEDYGPGNNGIYRTQITDWKNDTLDGYNSGFSIEVWGVFKYDDTLEKNAWVERNLTFFAYDENGFRSEDAVRTRQYSNIKPEVKIGAPDEDGHLYYSEEKFDENGNLGIYSFTPLSAISSYGAGTLQTDINTYYVSAYYTSLPMINSDGIYDIVFTDLFGQTYTQQLPVDLFGSTDIEFKVSNTEYTNKDVIVTAKALNDGDYITSISAVINGDTVEGTIDELNPEDADIIMTGNGVVTVTTALGKTHTIRVVNIDKKLEPVEVVFSYSGASEPEFVEGSSDTVADSITAIVVCDETLEGVNGPLSYTFKKGSAQGTKYVFEYSDKAGNLGTITAVLPYNIQGEPVEVPEVDTTSPKYSVNFYGMRNETNTYLGNYSSSDEAVIDIAGLLREYVAQQYAMIFDIEDDSATKLIVKKSGATAPTSYRDVSDTVEGVTVSGTMVLITENTEFDAYVVDAAGNISAFTGIVVNSVDNQAPLVTTEYEIVKDENGENVTRMYFVTEGDEAIISWDSDVYTYIFENDNGQQIVRYYRDFKTNEIFTFHYKDLYGNTATAIAEVSGMDVEKPIVQLVSWFGTKNNLEPGANGSGPVNRDVTAILNISKAVSDVKLYKYNDSASDKKGDEITDIEDIVIEITGKNVRITYKKNVSYDILVEVIGSSNGKSVTKRLSAVTCIDKTLPVVTVDKAELSDDNTTKEFVFITDEPTILKENRSEHSGQYSTEHTWTCSSSTKDFITFMDAAGNIYEYPVDSLVADIDDKLLTLLYSKNADGSQAVSDALDLKLSADSVVYIKANKKAHIDMYDDITTVDAEVWTAFTLSDEFGFHAVKAEDANTGRIVYGNLAVTSKDSVAPVITFDTQTVYVIEGASVEKMEEMVNSGVTIRDNKDGVISQYDVTGIPSQVKKGIYQLTYTAQDETGNTTTANRILYVSGVGSPFVVINGEATQPFGTIITDSRTIKLDIRNIGLGRTTVKWKAGVKTSGQMKYDSYTAMGDSFTVPESGLYTVYIRTQDRNEYVTYIYVED
ncbi:MAG: hypothetical protein IJD58_03225 [Lachnospiraceae bacterium]|nr:hypothetical protein [Lachnospiraceae bacterium]